MERYTKFLLFNGYNVPDRIRELLELCGEDNRTGEIIACLEKEGLHDFAVTDGVSVGAYSYLKKHHKAILASKESVYQYRAKAPHQLQTEYYGWNGRTKRVCSVRVVEIPREGKKRLTSTRGVEGLMELKQQVLVDKEYNVYRELSQEGE